MRHLTRALPGAILGRPYRADLGGENSIGAINSIRKAFREFWGLIGYYLLSCKKDVSRQTSDVRRQL